MKKLIVFFIAALPFFTNQSHAINLYFEADFSNFNLTDSTKKPILILGGGYLLSPINITVTQKSKINYTSPIIVSGAGMLLLSSSIKRAQTDWHRKTIGGRTIQIDDYLSFVPNTLGVGLGLIGVKAKHNFKDRMLVATMANGIMLGVVNGLKYTTKILRPYGSAKNSFPSGHTAFAFTGAEIMHEEYGDQSILYSIAGYAIGGTTGVLRMVNNRHWVSDVVFGAGVGMASTKIAYSLLPWAKKKVFKNENLAILPMYLPKGAGLGLNLAIK